MTGNNIALSGLRERGSIVTQGSASLHPGLRVLRPFGTLMHRIDGLIFFHDDKSGAKKIVVSVKGGENVNVAMVRDLGHVVDREIASMGFFVTPAEPTRPMKEEAVSAGFYQPPSHFQGEGRGGVSTEYPKLQILTIEGLMSGTERPRYPDLSLGRSTFKLAQIEDLSGRQGKLL